MIGQMTIARALPRFNDFGRTLTPIFLLMDNFLYLFSTFSEKMKKIYRPEVLIFLQNAPSNSVLFSSLFISAAVSNASFLRVKFCENAGNIGIIYATDPLFSTKYD